MSGLISRQGLLQVAEAGRRGSECRLAAATSRVPPTYGSRTFVVGGIMATCVKR
jgi:hypothetical protein